MPIYEYQCTNCHHNFDMMQKFSDPPVKQCPNCSMDTVTKLISAPGFQLKGSGWYVTDFKNKNSKPEKTDTKTKEAASPEKAKETSPDKTSKATQGGEAK